MWLRAFEGKKRAYDAGDLSEGPYPFSFRTRQSSPLEPMVLHWGRVGCRQHHGHVSSRLRYCSCFTTQKPPSRAVFCISYL